MDTDHILLEKFIKEHPVQAAHSIEGFEDEEVSAFIEEISVGLTVQLISLMNIYKVANCLKLIRFDLAVELLEKNDIQKTELLLRQIDEEFRNKLLDRVSPKRSAVLRQKLEFSDHSVGALMTPLDFSLRKDMMVEDAIKALKREKGRTLPTVCVVNGNGVLEGIVRFQNLLLASRAVEISTIMDTETPKFLADLPVESIKNHPAWYENRSVPVVDSSQKLIGTINFESVQKDNRDNSQEVISHVMETSNALGELYRIGLAALLQSISK